MPQTFKVSANFFTSQRDFRNRAAFHDFYALNILTLNLYYDSKILNNTKSQLEIGTVFRSVGTSRLLLKGFFSQLGTQHRLD